MVNYHLGFVKPGSPESFFKPAGSYKFDTVFVKAIREAGYPVVFAPLKFQKYKHLIAFFSRELFVSGLNFGMEHQFDVTITDFSVGVGVALYAPRVVILPHVECYALLKHRLKDTVEDFVSTYTCVRINRDLLWRKALDLLAREYVGRKAVVMAFTEKQEELHSKVMPKANQVLIPPPLGPPRTLKKRVEKVYDVVIPIAFWKVCEKGFYNVVSNLVKMGLKVLVKDYSSTKVLETLAVKAGAHYKGFNPDTQEYFADLASAKVALDISVFETFGFRYAEAILVGTPVVSAFKAWIKTVPRIEELKAIKSFDYEELLSKQLEEVKGYNYENFMKAFKERFPLHMLDKGTGVLSWA